MASLPGRGAQVRLDGDAQKVARGAGGMTLAQSLEAKRVLEAQGVTADGYTADGATRTGTAAEDEILTPGGIVPGIEGAAEAGAAAAAALVESKVGAPSGIAGLDPNGVLTSPLAGLANDAPIRTQGSTTARTLVARFSETVNPMDFGAVANGGTNPASSKGFSTLNSLLDYTAVDGSKPYSFLANYPFGRVSAWHTLGVSATNAGSKTVSLVQTLNTGAVSPSGQNRINFTTPASVGGVLSNAVISGSASIQAGTVVSKVDSGLGNTLAFMTTSANLTADIPANTPLLFRPLMTNLSVGLRVRSPYWPAGTTIESLDATAGTVTLTQAPIADVPALTALEFWTLLTDAEAAVLEMDWLALQAGVLTGRPMIGPKLNYITNRALVMPNGSALDLNGGKITKRVGARHNLIEVIGNSVVLITNAELDGQQYKLGGSTFGYGIYLAQTGIDPVTGLPTGSAIVPASDVFISGIHVTDCLGIFGLGTTGVTINSNTIYACDTGINFGSNTRGSALAPSTDIIISNNQVARTRQEAIDLNHQVQRCLVVGNVFDARPHPIIGSARGEIIDIGGIGPFTDIIVDSNTFRSSADGASVGVHTKAGLQRMSLSNNSFTGLSAVDGLSMLLADTVGLNVNGNKIDGGFRGIVLANVLKRATISFNDIVGVARDAISASSLTVGSNDISIHGNTMDGLNAATEEGIDWRMASNGRITGNAIRGFLGNGIRVDATCSDTLISGNSITESGATAIYATGSVRITISQNTIRDVATSVAHAIEVAAGTDVKVCDNQIRNVRRGIVLSGVHTRSEASRNFVVGMILDGISTSSMSAGSRDIAISQNLIDGLGVATEEGIDLRNCSRVQVQGNHCTGFVTNGIRIDASVSDANISLNHSWGNSASGIFTGTAIRLIVTNNNFSGNTGIGWNGIANPTNSMTTPNIVSATYP